MALMATRGKTHILEPISQIASMRVVVVRVRRELDLLGPGGTVGGYQFPQQQE
jgi:hypothetical protein